MALELNNTPKPKVDVGTNEVNIQELLKAIQANGGMIGQQDPTKPDRYCGVTYEQVISLRS